MWTILCACVGGDAPWHFLFKKPLFTEMQFDNQQLSRMTHSPNCCVGAGPCCPIFPEPLYPWSQIKWQWVALRRSLRAEQGGDNGITLMIPNCVTQLARGERTDTSASLLTRRFGLREVGLCHFLLFIQLTRVWICSYSTEYELRSIKEHNDKSSLTNIPKWQSKCAAVRHLDRSGRNNLPVPMWVFLFNYYYCGIISREHLQMRHIPEICTN